jgi:replication-associated recombination protein RarA
VGSMIFYGPPGTGKTTLARIVAHTTRAHFEGCRRCRSGSPTCGACCRSQTATGPDRRRRFCS